MERVQEMLEIVETALGNCGNYSVLHVDYSKDYRYSLVLYLVQRRSTTGQNPRRCVVELWSHRVSVDL